MRDIVLLDKDRTLGDWTEYAKSKGLYKSVRKFLELQKAKERELYVATTGGQECKEELNEVLHLLHGFLSLELLCIEMNPMYITPQGLVRRFYDDFVKNDEKKWVHKGTGIPFDESTEYRNPRLNPNISLSKDLLLARRIIDPVNYENLRCVLVGDSGDIRYAASDPYTPIVVISERQRKGDWTSVTVALDFLFSQKETPWEMFDKLKSQNPEVRIHGKQYELKTDSRILECS